jgi:hypothetical protein
MNNCTYLLLPDLPPPPAWLINQVDLTIDPATNNTGYLNPTPLSNWRGYAGPAAVDVRIKFNDAYVKWVQDNITQEFSDVSLNYVTGTGPSFATVPHRDVTRDFVIGWNINTGGDNTRLNFWQETGYSLIRDPKSACGDLSKLTLIDSVTGPKDCWYLLNAQILHNTDYLEHKRINLQISFKNNNNFINEIIKSANK